MELIRKYFPKLTSKQLEQLDALLPIYSDWNHKINLISRKDMGEFYERHVLHSLAIAYFVKFDSSTRIMDAGTGGGFPGIPLAILFPHAQFLLVDSIGKKIMVVKNVAEMLQLDNVSAINKRIEGVAEKFDFIISRAVTSLPDFLKWTSGKIHSNSKNNRANGIIYLKGGDIQNEITLIPGSFAVNVYPLRNWYDEVFFDTKVLVHIF